MKHDDDGALPHTTIDTPPCAASSSPGQAPTATIVDADRTLSGSPSPARSSDNIATSAGGGPAIPFDADELVTSEARPWVRDEGEIARGGMASVRRVLDHNLRRRMAMKVLAGRAAEGRGARRRLIEEAQITGQLDHPNIPPVHDLWIDEQGRCCFTMKLVRGQTLKQLLAAHPAGTRDERELERLLRIYLKVCDGVSFAHSRGVVHRDLKPDNIMVGTHGQVYVMDWGCALLLAGVQPAGDDAVTVERDPSRESLDSPGAVIGTCTYMAPEQANALTAQIDEQTDVYLLGGVLYEILTGRPPHRGYTEMELILAARRGAIIPPQQRIDTKLPPELCRIAVRALQARPADRHVSVEELKEDVERALNGGWWFASAHVAAGVIVVREGEPADAAYIITAGTCEVFRQHRGERVTLRRLGPGDVFGETAIFTGQPRTASIQATTDLALLVVTRESLERELVSSWVWPFVRALAERFVEADARRDS